MIKCGVDIVRIDRLEEISPAIKQRFIDRVYTPAERLQVMGNTQALAGVFAAKEAVSKALGTGIGKVHWQDIEIIHLSTGEPEIRLHEQALMVAQSKDFHEWSVSISHDGGFAIAMVIFTT